MQNDVKQVDRDCLQSIQTALDADTDCRGRGEFEALNSLAAHRIAAEAPLKAEIATLKARFDDCAPYLKQGQAPAERMQQDQADILSLMESLKREKERAAMWPKHLLNLIERAREYVQDSLDAHEHSDGRDLLNEIDEALQPDARYCHVKTREAL